MKTIKTAAGVTKRLSDYDWTVILSAEPARGRPWVNATAGFTGSVAPFNRRDIRHIIGISDGENDGADWIAVFLLWDGRYVFVSAGCDRTGWDCQSGMRAFVSDRLHTLAQFGMSPDERIRLGL